MQRLRRLIRHSAGPVPGRTYLDLPCPGYGVPSVFFTLPSHVAMEAMAGFVAEASGSWSKLVEHGHGREVFAQSLLAPKANHGLSPSTFARCLCQLQPMAWLQSAPRSLAQDRSQKIISWASPNAAKLSTTQFLPHFRSAADTDAGNDCVLPDFF
jgi:hypothetical protein